MKKLTLVMFGIIATFLSLTAVEPINPHKNSAPQTLASNPYRSAVLVSQAEMIDLTSGFQAKAPEETWGGCFSKQNLNDFIGSLSSSSKFVNFRFATDDSGVLTCLMLCGQKGPSDFNCIRNGGSEKAFCPTACNTEDKTAPNAIAVSYNDYTRMSNDFQAAHPEKTAGGNIEIAALLEIINSLPKESDRVSIRFCFDPATNQTSVLFIGGHKNQSSDDVLMYRNGKTADAFCPTNCNRQ